ncbi:MAG: GNAT family N-acetyltransferase [Halovenus sp.]
MTEHTIRQARPDDEADIVSFTEDTWSERDVGDYIPEIYQDWIAADGPTQRTLVTEVDGTAVGICQARLVGDEEGWVQGIRVHPDHRREGHGRAMTGALFEWCRERGATVARNLIYGWNDAAMAQARSVGFEPGVICRLVHPEPTAGDTDHPVTADTASAWQYWTASDARTALAGLSLADDHGWALAELTRERLDRLAAEQRVFAVRDGGTRGMAVRTGTRHRSSSGETVADYAVGAWADVDAARALLTAVGDDAAGLDATRARVCIPATPRYVSDGASVASLYDETVYVFGADLTGELPG